MNEDRKHMILGMGLVIGIIAVIAGVVFALLPSEQETMQNEADMKNADQAQLDTKRLAELKDGKLSPEDLQTVIAGFEAYNKSVKILLDACASVESEADFRALGSLIAERGDDFLGVTSTYGSYRNMLMSEGYGQHPVLGPLMDQSEILVGGMSACMEVLAWEFGQQ